LLRSKSLPRHLALLLKRSRMPKFITQHLDSVKGGRSPTGLRSKQSITMKV
jgi:hypothetical protein